VRKSSMGWNGKKKVGEEGNRKRRTLRGVGGTTKKGRTDDISFNSIAFRRESRQLGGKERKGRGWKRTPHEKSSSGHSFGKKKKGVSLKKEKKLQPGVKCLMLFHMKGDKKILIVIPSPYICIKKGELDFGEGEEKGIAIERKGKEKGSNRSNRGYPRAHLWGGCGQLPKGAGFCLGACNTIKALRGGLLKD